MICDNARPCNTPPGAPLPASPPPAFARAWRLSAILVLGFASGLPLALTGQAMQAWLTVDGVEPVPLTGGEPPFPYLAEKLRGGSLVIDPDGPGPLFEVPLVPPQPEGLNFLP